MSARRRRREAPMPQSAAGLLRFFEEEIKGIKIRAELVLIIAALMIAMIIIANILF
ncbi:MAG: preprotein translocase subunit Sec61beta [Thaumarchaeota archaeon]|nr:preprotein translocase subunit Sec61beta [Candidatus Geocrenenecus arthurdayi]MCL7390872.1 preprotein translocase subunit Sec61beta [Candidatus Geocrenenecus arthurdayi]MCL7396440.1 preprotein translocase subunit Sec61beta [Candidatus Geocrenenecus arthurdayi]MCL7403359.1 preprotein translocase subunit Sec61beta [Candidatus Geocrenenecus arthurdayi]